MPRGSTRQPGFTLLELLVVMALIGLLAALVAPNLQRLVSSIDRKAQHDAALAELASLSFRAYASGQGFELSEAELSRVLQDGNPMLALPSGWRLRLKEPIRFNFVGLCSGGRLSLLPPDGPPERWLLQAPDCRLEEDHGQD